MRAPRPRCRRTWSSWWRRSWTPAAPTTPSSRACRYGAAQRLWIATPGQQHATLLSRWACVLSFVLCVWRSHLWRAVCALQRSVTWPCAHPSASRARRPAVPAAQIHNWATELTPESGVPSLEFVAVAKCYVVVNGRRTHIDLSKVPALSPRQLQLMAKASLMRQKDEEEVMISKTSAGAGRRGRASVRGTRGRSRSAARRQQGPHPFAALARKDASPVGAGVQGRSRSCRSST